MPSERETYLRLLAGRQGRKEAENKAFKRALLQSIVRENPEIMNRLAEQEFGIQMGGRNNLLTLPEGQEIGSARYNRQGRLQGYTTRAEKPPGGQEVNQASKSFYKNALRGNVTVPAGERITKPELLQRGANKAGYQTSIGTKGLTFKPIKSAAPDEFNSDLQSGVDALKRGADRQDVRTRLLETYPSKSQNIDNFFFNYPLTESEKTKSRRK